MLGLYYILSLFGLFRDTATVVNDATKDEIPASEEPAAMAAVEMVKTDAVDAATEAEASELATGEAIPNKLPKAEAAVTELAKAETPALSSSTREAPVSYLTLAVTTYLASIPLAQLVFKVGSTAYSSCSHGSFALVEALSLHFLSFLVFLYLCSHFPSCRPATQACRLRTAS